MDENSKSGHDTDHFIKAELGKQVGSKSEIKNLRQFSKKGNLTLAKIKSLIGSAIAQQRKKISDRQTPRTGVEKSQWVRDEEKGYGRSTKSHPILEKALTGAADGLTPVATAKQNQAVVEHSLTDPKNVPSLSAQHQAKAVLAATLAAAPTPTHGK